MKIKRSAKILIIISTVVIVLLAIIIPTTYFVLNKSTTDIVKGPTLPVETKPTTPALPQPEQNKPPVETEKPTEPKPEQPKPVDPAPEKPTQPELPKPTEPSVPPSQPEVPVVKPTSVELVKKIYGLSTPVFFEITSGKEYMGRREIFTMSGTAWAFDISKNTQTGNLKYYLATNHHVIDSPKIIQQELIANKNLLPFFGTSYSDFSYYLRLGIPTYQFDGADPKDQWEQKNSKDLTYFNSNQRDIVYSKNYLKISAIPTQDGGSSLEIIPGVSPNNNDQYSTFDFSTNSSSDMKYFMESNAQFQNLADPDFALIELKTTINNPLNINVFNNYKTNWIDKKISPFATRELTNNDEAYIGGFPSIRNWANKFPVLTTTGNDGSIFVTPMNVSSMNNNKKEIFLKEQPGYFQSYAHTGAYVNYAFKNLYLGHGASGSMLMNSDGQIVGIYWGGWPTVEINQTGFIGAVVDFSRNNTIKNWIDYLSLAFPNEQSYLKTIVK